jgi:hypothetical protein|tara:strand:- start:168 stop:758 length:591 start_codon:yes stop_codon:yes gene_type:complete
MTKKVKVERNPVKVKKTRKISEEQRDALRERMIEMRKKRKPAEYKNISKNVIALPDDDTYSFKNVKDWITHNKTVISGLSAAARSRGIGEKEKRIAENDIASRKAYIRYCEFYLKTGDWISMYSGQDEEHKVVPICSAMAYYADGTPKRSVGVFYPDISAVWTKDMSESEFGTSQDYVPQIKKTVAITDKQFTGDM